MVKDLCRVLFIVDGVGKVEIVGVQEECILVEVDQVQLVVMNIVFDEIVTVLGDIDVVNIVTGKQIGRAHV